MRDHSASKRRAALALSLIVLSTSACRRERDPVMASLKSTLAAAESRDADAVMNGVADGFRDAEGGGKADAAALVRRTLSAYQSLFLTISDVAIERGTAAAHARFKVRMSGRPRAVGGLEGFLPPSSRWSFDVRLEAGEGGWKIVWASWSRLEGGD